MKDSITIDEANELLHKHMKDEYNLHHSRESEVIMRALARKFGEDEEMWGISGLLHDLDWEVIGDDIDQHSHRTIEILKEEGYDMPEMFHAIQAHCEGLVPGAPARESKWDFSLAAAESVTGLIFAYTLMKPDKKIEGTKPKSINKKFKDKSFAAKVPRNFIADIEKTGLEKSEFFQIAIDAMTEIADELGM